MKKYKNRNPLLTSTLDYENLVKIIMKDFFSFKRKGSFSVCMGHGSDHYSNSTYPALDYMFKEKGFKNVFVELLKDIQNLLKLFQVLKNLILQK